MSFCSMRGLTKPVASRIYRDFERLWQETEPSSRGAVIDEFILENLRSSAFVIDPMSPTQSRWNEGDYLEFRGKALAAFARAKQRFETNGLDAAQNKATRLIDIELYSLFMDQFPISPYEAGTEGTWEYLSLIVLPDLVLERHPEKQSASIGEDELDDEDSNNSGTLTLPTRFRGGERNAFRRIWIRAFAVGSELHLLETALEDNLVAVFERTRVSQNPKVSKSALLAIAHLKSTSVTKIPKFEDIVRDAMKRTVRLMSVKSLDVLPEEALDQLLASTFRDSAKAFGYNNFNR